MVVVAFVLLALAWGFGSSYIGGVAGLNPLIAPITSACVLAAFGWVSRGQDAPAVFGRGFVIAYAAFIGLALDRATQETLIVTGFRISALNTLWPVTLLGGVTFALILSVAIAVPISQIPRKRRVDAEHNDRFLATIDRMSREIAPVPSDRDRSGGDRTTGGTRNELMRPRFVEVVQAEVTG